MSVINKMLQDLDKRQQPHELKNIAPVRGSSNNSKSKIQSGWLLLVVMLILLIVSYWYVDKTAEVLIIQEQNQLQAQNMDSKIAASHIKHPASELATPVKIDSKVPSTNNTAEAAAQQTKKPAVKNTSQVINDSTQTTLGSTGDNKVNSTAINNKLPTTTPSIEKQSQDVAQKTRTPAEKSAPTVTQKPIQEPSKIVNAQPKPTLEIKEVKLTPAQLADKFFKQAQQARVQGQLQTAQSAYEKALNSEPAMHEARRQLAAIYFGRNQNNAAIKLLKQGWQLFPQQSEFALLLAKVYYRTQQADQALTTLSSIPNTDANVAEKWLQIATISQQQQLFPQAANAYQQLTKLEPEQGRWWLGLAYNLDSNGQYLKAKTAYTQALQSRRLSPASRNYIQRRLAQLN
ncbi:MAG: tetratricopeptide repeat protein [Parashewanella sp.]